MECAAHDDEIWTVKTYFIPLFLMLGTRWTDTEKQAYRAAFSIERIVDEMWVLIGLLWSVGCLQCRFRRILAHRRRVVWRTDCTLVCFVAFSASLREVVDAIRATRFSAVRPV